MSVAAKKWVRKHSPAKGSAKTVLAELAWAGDASGLGARLSHSDLVTATGLSRATVQRALAVLERDDRIRRHRGCSCVPCKKAARGVVVFDVVMPELADEEPMNPGQMTLLAGASDQPQNGASDQPQVRQVVRQVKNGDLPQGEAGSSLMVRHLEEKRTEEPSSSEDARELVRRVEELLSRVVKPGWYVDRIALEALVMTWASHKDPLRAAAAVVASAMDHEHTNAAKLLGRALEWQRLDPPAPSSRRPQRPAGPTAPADLPDRFAKYNVAAGLAS